MTWDALIAGAGPAGAVASRVLARAGRRVLLVDEVPLGERKVGESLPGAARPLLRDLGLLSLVEEGPHLPSYGNLAAWGTSELIATDFLRDPHGPGWHLDRPRFDADLRTAAQRAGAVLRRARLRSAAREEEVWSVTLSDGETAARWLLDATGRRAAVARSLRVLLRRDDPLVALCAWAKSAPQDLETRTLVESVPDGWWYTARVPDGARVAVLHVDGAQAAAILRTPGDWCARLAATEHVKEALPGAVFARGPRATEACGDRLSRFVGSAGWPRATRPCRLTRCLRRAF